MDYIPPSLKFAAGRLNFSRSRFRLETQGATSVTPGNTLTIVCPENAILDLKSWRLMARVTTTKNGTISSKAPADFSSLISSLSVFVGGVCVSQATNDYGTIARVLKLTKSNRDRDGSIDGTLSHGQIDGSDELDDFHVAWTPQTGIFDGSTRYLPTSLTGTVTITIQLNTNAVLCYKEDSVAFGTAYGSTAGKLANAQLGSFSLSEIYATCDTINMSNGTYEAMLFDRLNSGETLPLVYREYHTFRKSGVTSTSLEVQCAISASSLDCLYTVMQYGNYNEVGVNTRVLTGVAANGDANTSNALYFGSFNGAATNTVGTLRYQYFINSVPQSSVPGTVLDAAADLSMIGNRTTLNSMGHMITALADFQAGKAIFPCVLNSTESPNNVRSGLDLRGSNSSCVVQLTNLTVPTAAANAQIPDNFTALVISESSQVMHIGGGRQITIEY